MNLLSLSLKNQSQFNFIRKKIAIVSCTLFLPTEHVEVHIVIVSTQVQGLEELIIPKPNHYLY
jgi:hypothetical protein